MKAWLTAGKETLEAQAAEFKYLEGKGFSYRPLKSEKTGEILLHAFYLVSGEKILLKVFKKNAARQLEFYSWKNMEQAERHLSDLWDSYQSSEDAKIQRKEAKKAFKHDLKVGDIVKNSWGYDQTNIEFYQVVEVVSEKSVKIREIKCESEEYSARADSCRVRPVKDSFCGETETRQVTKHGVTTKYGRAYRIEENTTHHMPWGH